MADRSPDPVTGFRAALPLRLAASLYGSYRWVEQQLFELTGAWAAEAWVPAVAVHLDQVSAEHGWHAELWRDRLPVIDGWDHGRLTRPLTPGLARLFEVLATAGGAPGSDGGATAERLGALHRVVLPRLLVTYRRHLRMTAEVADGPVIRVLRLVRSDELESWEAGEGLLEELATSTGGGATANGVQDRLETVLRESGTGSGLFRWPGAAGGGETG